MRRFAYYRSDGGERWVLCGRITGSWADELCSVWRRIREHTPSAHVVVDLQEITFIDEAGAQLLAEMQSSGADFDLLQNAVWSLTTEAHS
jgi:ABC-type transporter Mla MlaB component